MIVSARGQTKSRTARLLPSVTQRSPAIAALVLWRRTASGGELSCESGLAGPGSPEYQDPVASCQAVQRIALSFVCHVSRTGSARFDVLCGLAILGNATPGRSRELSAIRPSSPSSTG